jgi:hypothetical protein
MKESAVVSGKRCTDRRGFLHTAVASAGTLLLSSCQKATER